MEDQETEKPDNFDSAPFTFDDMRDVLDDAFPSNY